MKNFLKKILSKKTVSLKSKVGSETWSNYSLDTFFAPKLSELTEVGAPDLRGCTKSYGFWIQNFHLNTILRVHIDDQKKQLVLQFLRKVDGAFHEYQMGRDYLKEYLENRGRAITKYYHSLRCFEVTTILAYGAYEVLIKIIENNLYSKNDGSSLQRLSRIQNISKHAASEFLSGGISEEFSVPIWLTNAGIESKSLGLSFLELSNLLQDLANIAEAVSNPPLGGTAPDVE